MNDNFPITKSLVEFIKDKDRKVATLKGEWGVGKTFYWRDFFKKHKTQAQSFKGYSYVSLFGIQSLAELKKQVFANFELMNETNNEVVSKSMKKLSTAVRSLNLSKYVSTALLADIVESNYVENFIICIDDLERKEDTLTVSSILGHITTLTEEKGCKILLIYNDQKLDNEASKQINEYREKVVDLELTYQPSMERNLSIVWNDGAPDVVRSVFETIELNNIRIMQRVQWTLNYFKETFEEYSHLRNSFERNAVILTILHHAYCRNFEIHEALGWNCIAALIPNSENGENDDKRDKEPFIIIEKLQYLPSKEARLIVNYLVNGFVDFDAEKNFLTHENEQRQRNDVQVKLHGIWGRYNLNFVTSQEDFTKSLFEFIRDNLDDLWLVDIVGSISFIRMIDDEYPGLDELLEKSIDQHVEELGPHKSLDSHLEYLLRQHSGVIEMLKEKIHQNVPNYSMTESFKKVTGSNAWTLSDIVYFRDFSEDDYLNWMKNEASGDVIHLIATFLERFDNKDGNDQKVIETLRNALETIKNRSDLDKIRIEKLIERK